MASVVSHVARSFFRVPRAQQRTHGRIIGNGYDCHRIELLLTSFFRVRAPTGRVGWRQNPCTLGLLPKSGPHFSSFGAPEGKRGGFRRKGGGL